MTPKILAVLAVVVTVMLVACTAPPTTPGSPGTGPSTGPSAGPDVQVGDSQELKTFANREDLLAYLQEAGEGQSNMWGGYAARGGIVMEESMDTVAVKAAGTPAPAAYNGDDSGSASDYSTTNVQVQGVDEADIVKNDDKYLYVLSGETLAIVNAYPAADAELASETHIKGQPRDMLLDGDTLVVFTEENGERLIWPEWGYMPQPRWTTETRIQVYDVSDRTDPEKVEDYYVTGNYVQSRMLDGYIYAVITDNAYYNNWLVDVPVVRAGSKTIIEPKVHYFDNPESNYRFSTIVALETASGEIDAESYLMGYANTIMMSKDNLFVAYQKQFPYWRYDEENKERFFDVVLPLLPAEVRSQISDDDAWMEISAALEELLNNLEQEEKEDLFEEIAEAVAEWDAKRAAERQQTIIHKFTVDAGDVDYDGRGQVPGTLLNQFSMDEYDGKLRVATNTNLWTREKRIQHNNVYVLDKDMDIIGELTGIAEDERIYSTRFMGDRLYMVTFRQVDPFFVIDLSDPRDPEIMGELKIPGWSSYLHPYDENHIIGIGKETKEDEYGRPRVQGVKVALFDVSDPKNPIEVDMVEIGDAGSDSEALNDHKAFLFDKERELLVIPVREINGDRYSYDRVKQGAAVFRITEDGLELRKKITHYDGGYNRYWSWYGSPNAVRRALYMDDVLYTISMKTVKMHDLGDLENVGEVELPYEAPGDYYGGYRGGPEPMPVDVVMPVDDWVE